MNLSTRILAAALLAASQAHAIMNLGEGRIDLTLTSSVFYDSEIQSRDNSADDTIVTLRPALEYLREAPGYDLRAGIGLEVVRYIDNGQFDDENLFFNLSLSPTARSDGDRFVFSSSVNLAARTEARPEIGEIITTRNYDVNASLIYRPSSRFSIQTNAGYGLDDPDAPFSELETVSLGAMLSVPVSDVYSGQIGTTFQQTDSGDQLATANDTWTYYAGVGVDFTEKLTGSINAGWQERDLDTGSSESNPYLSASLTWNMDETTRFNLGASQTLGNTISDQTSETLSLNASVQRSLRRGLTASAGVGYRQETFQSLLQPERDDEEISIRGGLSYDLTDWGSVGMEVSHSDRSSNVSDFSYSRLRVGLTFRGTW